MYTKKLTLELMDKVLEDMKKKHPSNFVVHVIGDVDQVTKVMKDFDKAIEKEIRKFIV